MVKSLKSVQRGNDLNHKSRNYMSRNSMSRNLYKYVLKSLSGSLTAWHRIEISER